MDSLPKDLDQGLLLQELECPVCMEYMKPPITMCENGHNICPNCKPKLKSCPSCTKPFLQVRNLALESLSTQATAQKDQRQPERTPQSVECPFTKISHDSCPWKGPAAAIKDHVKVFHNNGNDTHEATGDFGVILTGLAPAQHYRKAVFVSDELFYVYWRIRDGSFYCAVLHVGEEGKAAKYKYKFTLAAEYDYKKISMSFPTRSILEDLEEILQSGDCVILNYNTVLKFMNPNLCLECELQINLIEPDPPIVAAAGTSEPELYAESDVHSSLFGRSRRHRKLRRHEREHNTGNPVVKPGRCVHGRRFRHCKMCKYGSFVQNSQVSSGADLNQNASPSPLTTGFYCSPSGHFAENATTEKCYMTFKVIPSAPVDKDLYPDAMGKLSSDKYTYCEKSGYSYPRLSAEKKTCNLPDDCVPPASTWKCTLCDQIAPKFPDFSPEPGWHVSSSPTDTKGKCKMCGQIRK